jgi:enoyl-CoA hydratase
MSDPVRVERNGPVTTVILNRPAARNAVNGPTATALYAAFEQFVGGRAMGRRRNLLRGS